MSDASPSRYVTAFNRDRDFYQVPLALAECGRLERLVTDLYLPDALAGSALARRAGLAHRHAAGLPSSRVEWSWQALRRQLFGLRRARSEEEKTGIFLALDRAMSVRSLAIARATGAGFFAYTGYALEAFSAPDSAERRRILFVYHPPAALAREVLERDAALHPEMEWSHRAHLEEMDSNESERLEAEIRLADTLVCASSFTRRSIHRILGDERPVTIVPYGAEATAAPPVKPSTNGGRPQVLFVGQGVQRKGLHHLLKVWKRRGDRGADLTLVVGRIDPGAVALADAPGAPVRILPPQSRGALLALFDASDVFAMPSLVEGFGLVYLEAFAAGCFVIGTANTGLPDLAPPPDAAAILQAGDLDALETALDSAIDAVRRREVSPEAIVAFSRRHGWSRFRAGIQAVATGTAP